MHPVGFEPTISASELPQTYALGRAATGAGDRLPTGFLNQPLCNATNCSLEAPRSQQRSLASGEHSVCQSSLTGPKPSGALN